MNQHPKVDTGLETCLLEMGREGHILKGSYREQEA